MTNHTIKSPLPGVFYRRSSPDAPAYVEAGDSVKAGDTIGLVEIMKSFHPITSDVDGVIDVFHVEDNAELSTGQEVVTLSVVDG